MQIFKVIAKEKLFYIILLVSILFFHLASLHSYFNVEISYSYNENGSVQLFYDDGATGFLESKSVVAAINPESTTNIGADTEIIQRIRLDFDGMEKITINTIRVKNGKNTVFEINPINYNDYIQLEHDCVIENEQESLKFISNGDDSYLVFNTGHIVVGKLFFVKRAVLRILKYICIILLLFFIYRMGLESNLCSANTRFVLLASLFGIIYSFTIIPWQTPDEWAHLKMIGEGFNNASLAEVLKDDMPFNEHFIKNNNEAHISIYELISVMTKKPSYMLSDCIPNGISYEFIRHFPAAIGIILGILLRLPTYWVMQLGELFSLLFYVIICNYALRLTPVKKHLFEVVMLLPMCIQQMGSINYDSVLLPLSFFFVAYILYLKYQKNKITIKDITFLSVILIIITITKLPYGLMGLMILILPWVKIVFPERLKKWAEMNKKIIIRGGGVQLAYQY